MIGKTMNAHEEVAIPTPDPTPEVTEITVEQERQNIVTAAVRRLTIAESEYAIATIELEAISPTTDEIRAAFATWVIQ